MTGLLTGPIVTRWNMLKRGLHTLLTSGVPLEYESEHGAQETRQVEVTGI
jgi:hypothetical protein